MPRQHTSSLRIEFGDCDPAQIVFYPNYFKWMDIAALRFFNACGIANWHEVNAELGIIGAPLVGASAKFVSSATYPEQIEIDTSLAEIRGKSFVLRHVIRRGETVLVEGEEIRIFAIEDPVNPKRIKAVAIPDNILAQWRAMDESLGMNYAAPLDDIRFLLNEIAGLPQIAALPGCAEATPDLVDAVLSEAGKFAAGVLAPLNRSGDQAGCRLEDGKVVVPPGWHEAYRQFTAGGWVGLGLSADHGGQGLPKCVATPVWEMWFAANTAFTMLPQLNTGEAEALLLAASDELKAAYLEKLVTGEWGGTMNLTEPQAGSDLAAIRTRAEPQADGSYRINGQKIFISYGDHEITPNIVHLVLARLPDAPPGVKGISMFLVPKILPDGTHNDVRCVGLEHKLGIHGSPTCAMSFGDNGGNSGGATGWIVGEPNRGLEYMFIMMNEARFGVGVQGIGIGERAYQQALAFAQERVQGRNAVTGAVGQPIIKHPDVRRMLLTMRARIMAARALAYTAAGWFDLARHSPDPSAADKAQRYVDLLMPVVKGWSTELCQQVCYDAIQVHGGMGFVEETGIAQHYRDARIITIYEGTTGIQANDLIGRKILRENGATLRELIADMRLVAAELDSVETLTGLARRFGEDIAALEEALDWCLANGRDKLEAVLAGAVPFLHLLGTVCGSWQMARIALRAVQPSAAQAYGADYPRGLVEIARFYIHALAVQAPALKAAIVGAGETAMARFALGEHWAGG